ncbi:MAG: pitrilysin family protein [Candidatus Babeliaceae bacterium]
MHLQSRVYKNVLSNGLTVLILPKHHIPKVSLQIWYNVGSKDERSGEKGIAHFIEHAIFKGTSTYSESDIDGIVNKLSGHTNAFTSYDYTGYLFDIPSQHWKEVLPIMADCMRNCTFKEELLNSELKAVIQELKMYNDEYVQSLLERMITTIFSDHPYHHPIIGYKQDLWSLNRQALVNFYNYHYIPNNATLVVVGDVHVEEVFEAAEKYFGAIPANPDYKKAQFYHKSDIETSQTVLYRDIKQPLVILTWAIPGVHAGKDYIFDLMSWIIGSGKGSRLYTKLVDELQLVTELESFVDDLFEHGLFCIYFQPKEIKDIERIIDIINAELADLGQNFVSEQELMRAIKKTEVNFLSVTESNQKLAYLLGKFFLALGNEEYLLNYTNYPRERLKDEIKNVIQAYLRPTVIHVGKVLPLPEQEKHYWKLLQEQSDLQDAQVLNQITRESEIETASHAHTIEVRPPALFHFPQAQTFTLSNGLKVLYHHNPELPKIDLILDLKAKHYYDPQDKLGLSMFVADLLQEGTRKYSAAQLAQEIELRGMELNTIPGQINMSMLNEDLEQGLTLLQEILTESIFEEQSVEKIRAQILADLAQFWDNPTQFIGQLAREALYKNHPYEKNVLGSPETVKNITREDILQAYKRYILPGGGCIALVGDLSGYDIQNLLENILGMWKGEEIASIDYPKLAPITAHTLDYPLNRDQVVLCYGGLSVARKNPDFDKLLLFDQVFTGGVLGGMHSRLFDLREQSGLFYTIGGSLVAGVYNQPGMVFIKTIVSIDKLAQAEKQIEEVIRQGAQNLTAQELQEAQRGLINSFVDHFASNKQIAATFLSLDHFNFPPDYFDKRVGQLMNVTIEDIKEVIPHYLNTDCLVKIRVGRI